MNRQNIPLYFALRWWYTPNCTAATQEALRLFISFKCVHLKYTLCWEVIILSSCDPTKGWKNTEQAYCASVFTQHRSKLIIYVHGVCVMLSGNIASCIKRSNWWWNYISTWSFEQQRQQSRQKVVPQVLLIHLSSTSGLEQKLHRFSDYLPSISSLMMEKQQLHPDWCWWRPAAPGLILSPLPGARLSLASAKGHRYTVLCPCPAPAYLIGGQEWPRRACQEPLSVGPRHQTQGPTLAPLLFEALGRLIGLLCRAPLWGSAQACSSCWVCRRRKEQRLIPLQVSLSVATLHFQWLRKVTSALDNPVQEPHKQHQLR